MEHFLHFVLHVRGKSSKTAIFITREDEVEEVKMDKDGYQHQYPSRLKAYNKENKR